MIAKIKSGAKAVGVVRKVRVARQEFADAKARGQVSVTRELAVGAVVPGAAWLTFRGVLVQVVAAILAGVVQVADAFVSADLAAIFTEGVIDGASAAIVGAGFIWCVFDLLRSHLRAGLFPKPGPDDQH